MQGGNNTDKQYRTTDSDADKKYSVYDNLGQYRTIQMDGQYCTNSKRNNTLGQYSIVDSTGKYRTIQVGNNTIKEIYNTDSSRLPTPKMENLYSAVDNIPVQENTGITENHYSELNNVASDDGDNAMYLKYLDDCPQSLVRNDQYFITLANQTKSLWTSEPIHQI